jgi:hypothetical protein
MGAAAAGAAGTSIAGLGLSAYSSVLGGEAKKEELGFQASQYDMQAQRAKRAADFGRMQAGLTDTVARENLNTTLGNIEVIRAAAHVDPTSPTTAAIESFETMKSDRARTAALTTINAQVAEDEASAAYLKQAQTYALSAGETAEKMGWLSGAATLLGGLGKTWQLYNEQQQSKGTTSDPTRLGSLY